MTAGQPQATLTIVSSGKCLDVYGATGDGVRVTQRTCDNGTNQQWRPQDAGDSNLQPIARHSNNRPGRGDGQPRTGGPGDL